ncbi:MAG: bifunctional folylpolyglutamate synthase/dihydrofolate synthase [Planctomycetota bacterium]|nr:MAG: bifunctional folylpolyglutamate synthase/dihydrofolate synthase [Planctomycetota bacterium]
MRGSRKPGPAARRRILEWLDQRTNFERVMPRAAPGGTFGLTGVRRLLAEVGKPQERFPAVHVAGTKGKGSTVAMLAAILQASGKRTGRYMSPHVHTIEERICVDGRPIGTADFVAAFSVVIPAVESLDRIAARRGRRGPTWFEVVTAAAFIHFAQQQVDVAVLETGLGGRLDATNVCRPEVTVITSISLDHMALLGPTVARIAAEKAGIIKRGCPVVSGAVHPAAARVIAATARRRRAPLLQLGRDFHSSHVPAARHPGRVDVAFPDGVHRSYRLSMAGRHQADNAALAVVAAAELDRRGICVPERAVAAGLSSVRLPARIETVASGPLVVVDAAHNVASMEALVGTLAAELRPGRPRALVFAASRDKQVEQMLATATGSFDRLIVTRYATNPRAAPVDRLVAACRLARLPPPTVAENPADALRLARSLVGRHGIVVVAGSFFLAAEIRNAT